MMRENWDNTRWPTPPCRVAIYVRQKSGLTSVPGFPIPCFTTILELRLILGLYFLRTPAVHIFYGDVRKRRNLMHEKDDLLVSQLIGKDSDPYFTIHPFHDEKTALNKLGEKDRENTQKLKAISFRDQMEHLLKSLPKNGAKAQGIKQLVTAMHEGYFRHGFATDDFIML